MNVIRICGFLIWGSLSLLPCIADEPTVSRTEVFGEIVDAEGLPAQNVKIEMYSLSPPNGMLGHEHKLNEFVTDGGGRFHLEVETAESNGFLRITPPQGPVVSRGIFLKRGALAVRPFPIRFQLSNFQAAEFQVVDEQGTPISQANVHRMTGEFLNMGPLSSCFPSEALRVGQTDEAGRAQDFIEKDRPQLVWVEKPGFLIQGIVIAPREKPFQGMLGNGQVQMDERPVGQEEPYRIVLHPAREISGRVIDSATGLPVPNANISFQLQVGLIRQHAGKGTCVPLESHGTTDADGSFSNLSFPSTPLRAFAYRDDRMKGVEIPISPNQQSINIGDVALGEGVEITGQLWDVDRETPAQIDGGRISVRSFTTPEFTGPIEHDGSFKIRVPELFEATAYLLPHPEWAERSNSRSSTPPGKSAIVNVTRRPPVLTDTEVLSEFGKLAEEYRLEKGQLARRFDRPFSRSREAFFQSARFQELAPPHWLVSIPRGHLRTIGSETPTSPNGAVFIVDSEDRIRVGISTHSQLSVGEILMSLYPDMGYDRIRSPNRPMKGAPVLGDFVVRDSTPISELVPAINEAFQQPPRIPFHLRLHEEPYLTGIVKNRPAPEVFASTMKLELIPEGYEGPTETLRHRTTWGRLINQVVTFRLGLHWKLDMPDTAEEGSLEVTVPRLENQMGFMSQEQRQAAAQARKDLELTLRQIAPAAFKSGLGVDLEIREIPLPVVIIE